MNTIFANDRSHFESSSKLATKSDKWLAALHQISLGRIGHDLLRSCDIA